MKHPRNLALMLVAVFLMAGLWSAAFGQSSDGPLANVGGGGSNIRFDVLVQNAGSTLTITAPDGRAFSKEFKASISPEFALHEKLSLPDGNYSYELRLKLSLTPAQQEALKKMRGDDDDPEAERAGRKRPVLPNMVQSGSFAVVNGQIVLGGLSENGRTAKSNEQPANNPAVASGNTATRLRNHRASLLSSVMFDIVHADDVIIQGSLCVGLDCVNNENFGFDTIRLKENNTRIKFDDTSVSAGFSANDWQLTANDSASGGASKFSIEDITGSRVPFTITAGAATNSIFVDSTGRLGLRTSTPVLDIHASTSNTPALRFEQNNSGGFVAQTWDVAGNEANFFVRDVTGGSRLPFRIRPGAPTSSIDINASGNVGVGTASPGFHFHVTGSGIQTAAVESTSNGNNAQIQFIGKTSGGTAQSWLIGENLATTAGNFEIFDNTASQNRFFINTAGNVGIGTTAPDQKFSVNGDASKTGGATWQAFSDVRLKNIKGNFNSGLKAVMQLQPLRYQFKPDNALGLKSEREQIGFSAQALQQVIPEAVSETASGYLMVNSDPILWTMLNAIKEQQKEIEQLKGQILKLKKTAHRRRK